MSGDRKNVQSPVPTSPAGVPRVVSLPLAPPATADASSLLGKPALLLREGFRGRKGRAGTEITDVGRGWSPNQALGQREKDVL